MSGLSLSPLSATVPPDYQPNQPDSFSHLIDRVSAVASNILVKRRTFDGYKQEVNLLKRRLEAAHGSRRKEIEDEQDALEKNISQISKDVKALEKEIESFEKEFKKLRGNDEGVEPGYQQQMNEIRSSRDIILRNSTKKGGRCC